MRTSEVETTERKKSKAVSTSYISSEACTDRNCHLHGNLKVRGRTFEGTIVRKFQKRVTIEFERMIYVKKYERYKKSKTKIHARLPNCIKDSVKVGDKIKIQECRPLSKIIHFVVIKKIKGEEEK